MLRSSGRLSKLALRLVMLQEPGKRVLLLMTAMLMVSISLQAQNYSWDARSVGMGGVTSLGEGNLAAGLVPSDRSYTSIVVPLGLIQVLPNLNVFDPNDPEFDILRAVDYAGSPFHYSFNRSSRKANRDFLKNIVDSEFSTDLTQYRGFRPPEHLVAGGLLSPSWGYTFKFHRGPSQSFQGIYLGAGPYVALQTDLRFDPRLVDVLDPAQNFAVPQNTVLYGNNLSSQQAAVAIVAGYRAKVGFASSLSERDGVYLAFNFSNLIGLRRDVATLRLNLETDAAGLLTLTPGQVPVSIDLLSSNSGRGFSTEFGFVVVKNGWEAGLGVEGLGNRIDWKDHQRKQFALESLFTGVDFTETALPVPTGSVRQELPKEYVANLGYSAGRWTVRSDWIYGLQKFGAHGGAEYRLSRIAFRGGARYGTKKWNPTGGLGLNLTRRFGIDVGFFGNSTNMEQIRNISMAISLRIEHPQN
jgi:hypothetical protein